MTKDSYYGVIYKATNVENGKMYIGQTIRPLNIRIGRHVYDAKAKSDTVFHKALNKYGKDKFNWNIIDYAKSQEELDNKEKYWIKFYNTFIGYENSNGYNMTTGGYGASGENHPSYNKSVPEEVRDKISNSLKNRYTGDKNPLSKPVIKLSVDGEFIKRYDSMSEATREYGNHIGSACNGNINSAHGYLWIYEKDYSIDAINDKVKKYKNGKLAHNKKRVIQLDMDGNFINVFESTSEAVKHVSNSNSSGNIINCCNGKLKSAYGYIWVYEEEYLEDGE